MSHAPLRQPRHDLRGALSGLLLGADALPLYESKAELVETLEGIEPMA